MRAERAEPAAVQEGQEAREVQGELTVRTADRKRVRRFLHSEERRKRLGVRRAEEQSLQALQQVCLTRLERIPSTVRGSF